MLFFRKGDPPFPVLRKGRFPFNYLLFEKFDSEKGCRPLKTKRKRGIAPFLEKKQVALFQKKEKMSRTFKKEGNRESKKKDKGRHKTKRNRPLKKGKSHLKGNKTKRRGAQGHPIGCALLSFGICKCAVGGSAVGFRRR